MPSSALPVIEHIDAVVFRLPMHGALQWGKSSRIAEIRHVLVRATLSSGAAGLAEAPPRPTIYGETTATISSILRDELAPRVLGLPVLDEEKDNAADATGDVTAHAGPDTPAMRRIQERLHQVKANHAAKGALDMALHAAIAQHRGVSLAAHLGAEQARLPVSYILGIGEREVVLEEAQRVVSQGVRVLKVKVGRDWEEDITRIRELQAMLGAAVALYADANECMEAETAPARLQQLAEMGLLYCEEPLPVEQLHARARLAAGRHLPLIADDSAFSLRELNRELAFDTFDVLNIKTARTGFTESLAMERHALAAGKGIMIGSQASAGLGTARAAVYAARRGIEHPSELSFQLKLKEDILDRPLPIHDGYLRLADADAAQVDADLLRAATVDEG